MQLPSLRDLLSLFFRSRRISSAAWRTLSKVMKLEVRHLKRCLLLLAAILCVLGFAWLVREQVEKFFNRKTAVAVSYDRVRFHKVSGDARALVTVVPIRTGTT